MLGIGTDVGGSIRTPASFCGIAGFKSSSDRTPQLGKTASIPGRQLLLSVEGPLAHSIDTCIEYLKLKWNDPEIYRKDVYMPPVPFQQALFDSEKKLRIGYYTFDGYQHASPAYQRAVKETVKVLEDAGHEIVEFEVPRPDDMYSIFCAGATADGGLFLMNSLHNVSGVWFFIDFSKTVQPIEKWSTANLFSLKFSIDWFFYLLTFITDRQRYH